MITVVNIKKYMAKKYPKSKYGWYADETMAYLEWKKNKQLMAKWDKFIRKYGRLIIKLGGNKC